MENTNAVNKQRQGLLFEPIRNDWNGQEKEYLMEQKQLVEEESPEKVESRLGNEDWCVCTNCQSMPTNMECVCCNEVQSIKLRLNEIQCITETKSFTTMCLNNDVLEMLTLALRSAVGISQRTLNSRNYRYAAYRSFTFWTYGKLGKANRKIIPSCVIKAVRNKFPDENGVYEGYHDWGANIP